MNLFDAVTFPAAVRRIPFLFVGLVALAGVARGDGFLKPIGGDGGGQFIARCPPGQSLAGVELRAGDDVDAIRPVCVVAYGAKETSVPALTNGSGLVPVSPESPVFKAQKVASGWYGGPGGGIVPVMCPASTPIVIGMDVAAEGNNTVTVNSIHLFCGLAVATQVTASLPSAVFDGPTLNQQPIFGLGNGRSGSQRCPSGSIAVGVHGRAGTWLDSVALICDVPHLSPNPHPSVALGRVTGTAPAGPPMSICDRAKAARARNSPAAASLEEQCRAQKPSVSLGRVVSTAPADGPPVSVCDAAAAARDRNSPTAPALAARCKALGGQLPDAPAGSDPSPDELAAKGEAIAGSLALAADLRNRQPEGPIRRGFDIGLGAAEGQTAWGPGKQKILSGLTAGEQEGFKVAISFALDQNRNADLALVGAAIAEADPVVAQARARQSDPRSKLGFDIASAIFGDPALGAQGNTATGPGSLGIRNALSAPAQLGFNASTTLHLSRKY